MKQLWGVISTSGEVFGCHCEDCANTLAARMNEEAGTQEWRIVCAFVDTDAIKEVNVPEGEGKAIQ